MVAILMGLLAVSFFMTAVAVREPDSTGKKRIGWTLFAVAVAAGVVAFLDQGGGWASTHTILVWAIAGQLFCTIVTLITAVRSTTARPAPWMFCVVCMLAAAAVTYFYVYPIH